MTKMTHEEKVDRAFNWFTTQGPTRQAKAVRELFDHAIRSEWVSVWSDEDAEEMNEERAEEGLPPGDYAAPYYTTCGEPVGGTKPEKKEPELKESFVEEIERKSTRKHLDEMQDQILESYKALRKSADMMSPLDVFAGLAMNQHPLTRKEIPVDDPRDEHPTYTRREYVQQIARDSYEIAEAMMTERAKRRAAEESPKQ